MGRRGPKPKGKVKIKWAPNFAYAIGLLVTDGCLINNGRHIEICSKDREQLENFCEALKIEVRITGKNGKEDKKYMRVQFGDVLFYTFLQEIGLSVRKSKTIGPITIPDEFFFDYLRGCFDGDGCFYSYWDPRWKSSFMFYLSFVSASQRHITWLRTKLSEQANVYGHVTHGKGVSVYQLKYAKAESLKILKNMYYSDSVLCLSRKRKKIEKGLKEAGIDK